MQAQDRNGFGLMNISGFRVARALDRGMTARILGEVLET
jgi:hypothetical protein